MKLALIIDDSKSVHAYVKSCLVNKYEFDSTFNGEEGLQQLQSNPGKYEFVLLDWEMPVLEGPDTLAKIRELKLDIPVIMMTTRNSVEDISKVLELGANDYMMKPFTTDIILEKLSQILAAKVA